MTSFRQRAVTEGQEPDVWFRAAPVEAFPEDGGACVKIGKLQVAVFNFTRSTVAGPSGTCDSDAREWYACQNLCPHRLEMALSRGILGSSEGVPKVACPYHKATFDLTTGACLSADFESLATYPVRIEGGHVLIGLTEVFRDPDTPASATEELEEACLEACGAHAEGKPS